MSKKVQVLILEDDVSDAELVKRELRRGGVDFGLQWVQDKAGFIQSLEGPAPDIILADYSLPGFDGLTALSLARQRFPEIPVIIVSGNIGEELGVETLKAGATDYVLKQRLGRLGPAVGRALQEAEQSAERKRAQQALRENEARFKLLSKTADRLLKTDNPQAIVEELCRAVMEHLGCDCFFNYLIDEATGKLHLNACAGIPEDEARGIEWLDCGVAVCGAVARSGERIVAEDIQHVEDPRTGLVRSYGISAYACHPLRAQGGVIGTLSFGTRARSRFSETDLSLMKAVADEVGFAMQRRRMEEEMVAAKQAAEAASKAKDDFLAMLSHELRTPLTPVLAAVSMLQREARLHPELRGIVDLARRNVELEARLIDDLLDLTRIARGKLEIQRRPVDLRTIVDLAVEVCRAEIEAHGLTMEIASSAQPQTVEADVARLQQVFWNLLRNAVKFTPAGGRIVVRVDADGPGCAVVEVEDSGEGIAPEHLPILFNAFEQGEHAADRDAGGLGLGLAIGKALVELHGGTIGARSEGKGQGACFTVRLPLTFARPEGAAEGERPDTSAVAPLGGSRPLRVLLVDDHVDTARLWADLLEMEGHRVQTAGDVATALDLAGREHYDVLISDLGLPDGSGLDLMRCLRSRGMNLPGIVLSGYGLEQDIRASLEAGFATHIVKPVEVERLLAALEQVTSASIKPAAVTDTVDPDPTPTP